MSLYRTNKTRAIYRSAKPTKTDQAAAKDTDINVIMKQYNITGMISGSRTPPSYGDYTQARDLQTMLNWTRDLRSLEARLPEQLKGISRDELLHMTTDELAAKLKLPEPPAPNEAPK